MSGIMDSVNKRTQMVGQNRLELLLFRLQGKQVYGINVFKVKEVLNCPEMDGYTFTTEVRANPDLKDLHILLHTSLSCVFNNAMVEKVGADNFIPKFDPNELAAAVQSQLKASDIIVEQSE